MMMPGTGEESCCLTSTAAQPSVRHHPPNYWMESRPGRTIWLCVLPGQRLWSGGWGRGGGTGGGGGGEACVVGDVCLEEIRKIKTEALV